MSKRASESGEENSRSARYEARRQKIEAEIEAKMDPVDRMAMKVDLMKQHVDFLKEGKAKIAEIKSRIAEEEDDATAQEQILKTLIAEKPIIEERCRIYKRYPEAFVCVMEDARQVYSDHPFYRNALEENAALTEHCELSLEESRTKISQLAEKLSEEESKYADKEKALDSMTENIVIGKIEVVEVENKKSCAVCLEAYDEIDIVSACLKTCGHAFCESCLQRVFDEKLWGCAKCPSCVQEFDYDDILKIFNQ